MQWNKRSRRAGFILAAVVALAGGGIAAAYYTVIATGSNSTSATIPTPSAQVVGVTVTCTPSTNHLAPGGTISCNATVTNTSDNYVHITTAEIIVTVTSDHPHCSASWFTTTPKGTLSMGSLDGADITPDTNVSGAFVIKMTTSDSTQDACWGTHLTIKVTLTD
jgi:hypothetical protein